SRDLTRPRAANLGPPAAEPPARTAPPRGDVAGATAAAAAALINLNMGSPSPVFFSMDCSSAHLLRSTAHYYRSSKMRDWSKSLIFQRRGWPSRADAVSKPGDEATIIAAPATRAEVSRQV